MDYLEDYENIVSNSKSKQSISDEMSSINFDDSELMAEQLAKSLARLFLATHRRKIDKALAELKIDR
jgi:hypothetical protein